MKRILFTNETFRKDVNYTVRLGVKYTQRLQIGDIVKVNDAFENKSYTGHAIAITSITVCQLRDMPTELLKRNHDIKCVTQESLIQTLMACYNIPKDEHYKMQDKIVTVIGFKAFFMSAI